MRFLFQIVACCCALAANAAEAVFQLPPGFAIQRVARSADIQFPMFATLDDRGGLYVTESSGGDLYDELLKLNRTCRIRILKDLDRDGFFESAQTFAEGLTPSMGLVWRDGKLFAADPPDLVTFEDTDGDGRADKRTVVLTGFGHTDNGSLHGLTFGPDGWLYFTMGSPDGFDLRGPDGSHARGKTGALIRSRPDGSRVEVIARGFENLVEVVFLPNGSIVGTLTWYQRNENGLRDALVHILEGAQFPLTPVDQVPHLQFNAVLPPMALFPAVAHSGLALCQSEQFPPEMRGRLFSAQFNSRRIVNHRLTPKGSSFAVETFDFVTTDDPDVHFSDVLEDGAGGLLLVDSGSWYVQHCPTGRIRPSPARGGLYRVTFPQNDATKSDPPSLQKRQDLPDLSLALRSANEVLIAAAARAAGRQNQTIHVPVLNTLLRSPQASVQLAAAEALAQCGNRSSVPALMETLAGETDAFLEHALTFALSSLGDQNSLTAALEHRSPKVQRAALLLLDQPPFQTPSEHAVLSRLTNSDPIVHDAARWVLRRHPEWTEAGAALLQSLVALPNPTESDQKALAQFLPRFQSHPTVVATLAQTLAITNAVTSDPTRARLLETLTALGLRQAPEPLAANLLSLLHSTNSTVRTLALQSVITLRVTNAQPALARLARDPSQPTSLRLRSTRELIRLRSGVAPEEMTWLLNTLAATNPPAIRLAAAETLFGAKLNPQQLSQFLTAARGESLISPTSILTMLNRYEWPAENVARVLDYLEFSLNAGWTVPTDLLAKVRTTAPPTETARAESLLRRHLEILAQQRQQLASFAELLKGGNPQRGEGVFQQKAQCAVCHRVNGAGGRIGPDLTGIGRIRSGPDLLESILIPSSSIAQGYETLEISTKDGERITGVSLDSAGDLVRLRTLSGEDITFRGDQLQRIDRSKQSLMPEGLLQTLTQDEARDLLSYLQQLK